MMNKERIKEILLVICVSYTIISLVDAGLCLLNGRDNLSAVNSFNQLFCSTIAVTILYTHNYLERFSPLTMVVIQYVAAMGIVFLLIFAQGLILENHPDAYRDIFVSFTVFYCIGASIYYISVFGDVMMQNRMLREIRGRGE